MATVLVFVDLSISVTAIVRIARDTARAFGMKLILMHVSTPDAEAEGDQLRSDLSPEGVAMEMHRYHKQLGFLAKQCIDQGIDTQALLVRSNSIRGNPVPKMVRELKRIKPALIVMGTHQHGRFFDALFGSASSKLVHKATCPILLVPSGNRSIRFSKNR